MKYEERTMKYEVRYSDMEELKQILRDKLEELEIAYPTPITPTLSDDTLVDALGLSVRASSALKNSGIQTIGELRTTEKSVLARLSNFGKTSLKEVVAALESHFLSIRDSTRTKPYTFLSPDSRNMSDVVAPKSKPTNILDLPAYSIFPDGAYFTINRLNCKTIGDLCNLSVEEIKACGINKPQLKMIINTLADHGLKFGGANNFSAFLRLAGE
jgi:hypothetical protein